MNHSEPPPNPRRLVDEYFLRDFTEQEIDELNTVLAMNPVLKAEFIRSMHDDLDLYETLQSMQEEQMLKKGAIVFPQRRSARSIRVNRINRMAAALAILLSVGALIYRVMNPPPAPVIAESPVEPEPVVVAADAVPPDSGTGNLVPEQPGPVPPVLKNELRMVAGVTDLFLLDGDRIPAENEAGSRQLRVGDLLAIEDKLVVPAGARLSIKYLSDATTVSFEENSSFRISESDGSKHLELYDGRMVADVDKQQQGKPFRIMTDDAELVVIGTRFELSNREETILSVHSGEIQMKNRADDHAIAVPAGHLAASIKGKLSKPVAFRHELLRPVSSRTLPGIPEKHKKTATAHIIVDSERNLRGRLDFMIPRIRGRISEATLRLRVVPFGTDNRGGGTIRVKRAGRKNAPDMGRHSGEVKVGMDLIFNIDPAQLSAGNNTLLLEMDEGGNDFWIGAENSSHPPELHLTIIRD